MQGGEAQSLTFVPLIVMCAPYCVYMDCQVRSVARGADASAFVWCCHTTVDLLVICDFELVIATQQYQSLCYMLMYTRGKLWTDF